MGPGLKPGTPGRRLAFVALVLAVLALHGGVSEQLAGHLAEVSATAAMPPRLEVAYVRELEPAPPPVWAAPAAPPPRPAPRARPPRPAASRPEAMPEPAPAEAASEPPPTLAAAEPEPVPPETVASASESAASAPEPAASAPAEPAAIVAAPPGPAASGAGEAFEWPASTRLTYALTGNYRGEVLGDAQVEWVRAGARYQVHLDITIGAHFAPLITRRMSSDGELSPDGLSPQTYDEDTKVMFRERRRLTMRFERDTLVMPDGRRRLRPPGVQDTASQFVQMSFLFSTRPEMLREGGTVEVPLALPRNVDRWVYDVVGEEALATPFGELQTVHLRPRRSSRPGGDLVAEIWFAPQLRHLPVRIRIEQDPQTYIDLRIARKPELAGP